MHCWWTTWTSPCVSRKGTAAMWYVWSGAMSGTSAERNRREGLPFCSLVSFAPTTPISNGSSSRGMPGGLRSLEGGLGCWMEVGNCLCWSFTENPSTASVSCCNDMICGLVCLFMSRFFQLSCFVKLTHNLSVATSLSNLFSTEAKSSFCCLDDALMEKAAVCDLF